MNGRKIISAEINDGNPNAINVKLYLIKSF